MDRFCMDLIMCDYALLSAQVLYSVDFLVSYHFLCTRSWHYCVGINFSDGSYSFLISSHLPSGVLSGSTCLLQSLKILIGCRNSQIHGLLAFVNIVTVGCHSPNPFPDSRPLSLLFPATAQAATCNQGRTLPPHSQGKQRPVHTSFYTYLVPITLKHASNMQTEVLFPLKSFTALVLLISFFHLPGPSLSIIHPLFLLLLPSYQVFPIFSFPLLTHILKESLYYLSLLSLVQSTLQLLQSIWLLSTTLD